jgi:protoheme IX farnesyltransferase
MKRNIFSEYWSLTKSGLVAGNLIPAIAGFVLAARGLAPLTAFAAMVVGLWLVMASGCVFNNVIDADIDARMDRTKERAVVTKEISRAHGFIFGIILGAAGFAILGIWTNVVATLVAAAGFFFYVVAYTIWAKRRTVYGTIVGALAGAVPPVVGYAAASGRIDAGALILFVIMIAWQMPHFFAIAIRREGDYAAAGIPVMPVKYGVRRTKVSMLVYIAEFTLAAALLTLYSYEGYVYLTVALVLGIGWLGLGIRGFRETDTVKNVAWAKRMFLFSLVVLVALFAAIAIGAVA